MHYLLLIYGDESVWASMSKPVQEGFMEEFGELTRSLRSSGRLAAVARLAPTRTARTVRVRGGQTVTTDGPFAETREQLGGFYLIEAEDLDEAIAIAARVPSARGGSVEVRPIQTLG